MALSPTDEKAIAALVEQAKEEGGNHPAFEQLFLLYSNAIYRHLRYMLTDDEAACDLMQDSFLKAWESLHTLQYPSRFIYWLYQIATNKALNYIRRESRISQVSGKPADDQAIVEKPDDVILLKLALEQVQPSYRQCLMLQEIDGLSQNEIAEIVGIKKSSVSNYVRRGYEELGLAYQHLKSLEKTFLEREYCL